MKGNLVVGTVYKDVGCGADEGVCVYISYIRLIRGSLGNLFFIYVHNTYILHTCISLYEKFSMCQLKFPEYGKNKQNIFN